MRRILMTDEGLGKHITFTDHFRTRPGSKRSPPSLVLLPAPPLSPPLPLTLPCIRIRREYPVASELAGQREVHEVGLLPPAVTGFLQEGATLHAAGIYAPTGRAYV
jgi:hypothetical protein